MRHLHGRLAELTPDDALLGEHEHEHMLPPPKRGLRVGPFR
jgi:hypothetical protein